MTKRIRNEAKRINNYEALIKYHDELIRRPNYPVERNNGVFTRYKNPILTADHVPVNWRYDLNIETNPYGLERIGVNATFNAGAIKWNGKYVLAVRVEGYDRKSYFAFVESDNGIDNFNFWPEPLVIPQLNIPDINAYDMRLVKHEDGWIYGIFCTEKKDPASLPDDTVSAIANAAFIRSKDLIHWERLPNLKTPSKQQRNVTLHPEFVNGKYALYTRPQDGFITVGNGGGIGMGLVDDMSNPVIENEEIIYEKEYHTIYELKNGQGPSPIRTEKGWLHIAHGVRNTAAGLRYVLYMFITDLNDITKVIYKPGGYFMAPNDSEIYGDVGNVLFVNGWIADEDGTVFIYYASSDTRMHVAVSSINRLVDYCINTPKDGLSTHKSVQNITNLINKNKDFYDG